MCPGGRGLNVFKDDSIGFRARTELFMDKVQLGLKVQYTIIVPAGTSDSIYFRQAGYTSHNTVQYY